MTPSIRPTVHFRLTSPDEREGEITLDELSKLADQTQRVVVRIARNLVEDQGIGRVRQNLVNATRLTLVGLRPGSTILDIALSEPTEDSLSSLAMPGDLGEMALTVLVESLEILSENEEHPVLPVGVDETSLQQIDRWLRVLHNFSSVEVAGDFNHGNLHTRVAPDLARTKLRDAYMQPSLPYVSADHQALTGRLYAVNLRTGLFHIEDDARHSIRLTIPEELRVEAAQLIDKRVRAYGNASLNSHHRLISFSVVSLEEAPEPIFDQQTFFANHELTVPPRAIANSELETGIFPDLTEDDIDAFLSSFEAE